MAARCVGCGTEATGELGMSGVPSCKPCWDSFLELFNRGPPPVEGIVVPESPATRIADAILELLGGKEG